MRRAASEPLAPCKQSTRLKLALAHGPDNPRCIVPASELPEPLRQSRNSSGHVIFAPSPLATTGTAADKSIMSTTDLPITDSARTSPLLPVLIAAIFLSAALLFAVQPMFTKMVLPRLGGAPQVW